VLDAVVACMKEDRNAYKILVGNPEGKKVLLWRSVRRRGRVELRRIFIN
jgi:hypothetical protein